MDRARENFRRRRAPSTRSTGSGQARSTGSGQACRNRAGYTMIELIVVMLLLCIIAAISMPHMRNYVRGRAASDAAEQFVAVSHWARTQAVARGEVYRLNVDVASKTYWLTVKRQGQFTDVGEDMGQKFPFPDSVQVECDFLQQPDGSYVEFEPNGRTDEGNLRLTGPDGGAPVTISCLSTTETFRILPPDAAVNWGVHHTAKFIVGASQ